MSNSERKLPDAVVIAICFAIPPVIALLIAYAPQVILGLVVLILWIGFSAFLINLWFAGHEDRP